MARKDELGETFSSRKVRRKGISCSVFQRHGNSLVSEISDSITSLFGKPCVYFIFMWNILFFISYFSKSLIESVHLLNAVKSINEAVILLYI